MAKLQWVVVLVGGTLAACHSGSGDQSAIASPPGAPGVDVARQNSAQRPHVSLPATPEWQAASRGDIGLASLGGALGARELFGSARGVGPGAAVALAALPLAPDAASILWDLCMDVRTEEATLPDRLGALHAIVVMGTSDEEVEDPQAEAACRTHLANVAAESTGSSHDLAVSAARMLHDRVRR